MNQEEGRKEFLEAMFRMGKPSVIQHGFQGGELTRGEYFMLDVIYDHHQQNPAAKGMYVSELADLLEVSSPAVSRMLRGMERKGYLDRVVDREDRRTTYIIIQPSGELARKEMEERAMLFVDRVFARMGEADTSKFVNLWNRLIDLIEEERTKGT